MTALALYQKSISRAVFRGEWIKAIDLLRTMVQRNLHDTKSTNMVMDCIVRQDKAEKAIALLRMLKQPDAASYSIIMRTLSWQAALDMLQEMRSRSVPPNVFCYSAAISACERGGQWRHALMVLETMKEMEVQANTVTYNACISACEKGHQWELALDLLSHMVRESSVGHSNIHPDVVSFSAALSACAQSSQWKKAVTLLRSMQATTGVVPNVQCYNATIAACTGHTDVALDVMQALRSHTQPDLITYNTLIEVVADDTVAYKIYCEGVESGIYPSLLPPLVDFHTYSVRVARMALRRLIADIQQRQNTETSLVVIVGRGLGSSGEAKLKPALWELLLQCGLKPERVCGNPGRIRVVIGT